MTDGRAHCRSEAVAGRIGGRPPACRRGWTGCRRSTKRIGRSGHGAHGARGVGGGTRLLRTGVGHRVPCRRNRGGLQREKEGCARPPPPSSAPSPGPTGSPLPSSSRKRPRSRRADIPVDHRTGRTRRCLPRTRAGTRIDGTFPNGTMAGRPHSLKVECTVPVPFGRPPPSGRRWKTTAPPGGGNRSLRNPLEAEVAECPPSPHAHRKAGRAPTQVAVPNRAVPAHWIGCAFGVIAANGEWARVRSLPSMRVGVRRRMSLPGPGRIAERIACRSGDPDRQPTAHVRRHPARNLNRGLRIRIGARARGGTPKRAALRYFREMETLRRTPVRYTGRIIRPGGKLISSMNGNDGRDGSSQHAPQHRIPPLD